MHTAYLCFEYNIIIKRKKEEARRDVCDTDIKRETGVSSISLYPLCRRKDSLRFWSTGFVPVNPEDFYKRALDLDNKNY